MPRIDIVSIVRFLIISRFAFFFGDGRLGKWIVELRLRVTRRRDILINAGAKASVQISVDATRNRSRKMVATVGAARDHNDRELRIIQRRVRSEQTNPGALFDAGAGLAGDNFFRIESAFTRSVPY